MSNDEFAVNIDFNSLLKKKEKKSSPKPKKVIPKRKPNTNPSSNSNLKNTPKTRNKKRQNYLSRSKDNISKRKHRYK